MRFWKVALPLVALALLLPGSSAGRIWWSGRPQTNSYEVEIIVDGSARPEYYHGGHTYIEGRRGDRYVIRVHNRTWRRVEAVISVDGRDVIDGKSSSLGKRGYVIPAYSYVDVDGFRLSMHDVAAFRFTDVPDSYAARMGTPWNVGIIGVAIFPERVYRPRPRPRPPYVVGESKRKGTPGDWDQAEDRATAGSAEAAPRSRNLGTQFGERRASYVSETRFVRQNWSSPAARLSLRYDDREGLCNLGIGAFCYHPHPPWPPPYEPEPPPHEFAEPPPGWDHFSPWY